MNDFLKQDVFFLVTTLAVIIFTLLLSVFIFYLIRISKKIDYITQKAKEETDLLSAELATLRKNIRSTGMKVSHFSRFVNGVIRKYKK